jgi:hypothetical protein
MVFAMAFARPEAKEFSGCGQGFLATYNFM